MQREHVSRCIVLFLLVACCLILIFDTYDITGQKDPMELYCNLTLGFDTLRTG